MEYQPWKRPKTYIVFGLGSNAAMFIFASIHPFFAPLTIGLGIAAVLLAKKEMAAFPQAADQSFIKWGRRLGILALILAPVMIAIFVVGLIIGLSGGF